MAVNYRYLDNIYPELEIPEHNDVTISFNDWCLDTFGKLDNEVGLYKCHGKGGNQHWVSLPYIQFRQFTPWDV